MGGVESGRPRLVSLLPLRAPIVGVRAIVFVSCQTQSGRVLASQVADFFLIFLKEVQFVSASYAVALDSHHMLMRLISRHVPFPQCPLVCMAPGGPLERACLLVCGGGRKKTKTIGFIWSIN
ncbi:hypothetical protein F4802DRAFT_559250 [Xylaria palmicola]|nr:hypothetical protein F4802DRAFT_559250 [Xylaria palmicola]